MCSTNRRTYYTQGEIKKLFLNAQNFNFKSSFCERSEMSTHVRSNNSDLEHQKQPW
jgi:hypothetical protein